MKAIVSACLLGYKCRYDARSCSEILDTEGEAIPVCPECSGGLSIPRSPCEIAGGDGESVLVGEAKVLTKDGEDVTRQFVIGANITLRTALENGVTTAYLKSKSPSCGLGRIYDGGFKGKLKDGDGVTAALLKRNGINIIAVD